MKNLIKKIIFSGGGAKGISYVGIIKYFRELEESGNVRFDIDEMCCVSIGSVFGILYIIGYTYDELYSEIMDLDLGDLKKFKIKNFLEKYGMDNGKMIMNWLEMMFSKRGISKNLTLNEIWLRYGIDFKVMVTNVNKYCVEMFSYKTHPNLKVIKAIRMATSIPFIFCAEKYNGNVYVDGGILNNYPIKLYEDVGFENILGVKLITKGELSTEYNEYNEINSLETYMTHIFGCISANKERDTTLTYKHLEHTICINAYEITEPVNFSLTKSEKLGLIQMGYNSARMYFEKE